jgi:hypothetical protein
VAGVRFEEKQRKQSENGTNTQKIVVHIPDVSFYFGRNFRPKFSPFSDIAFLHLQQKNTGRAEDPKSMQETENSLLAGIGKLERQWRSIRASQVPLPFLSCPWQVALSKITSDVWTSTI